MHMRDMVPPVRLCKKLPKSVFKTSYFKWINTGDHRRWYLGDKWGAAVLANQHRQGGKQVKVLPAPVTDELLDALKTVSPCKHEVWIKPYGKGFEVQYNNGKVYEARSLAEAEAHIYITIKEGLNGISRKDLY